MIPCTLQHTLNQKILSLFPGEEHCYHSTDSQTFEAGVDKHAEPVPIELLQSFNASGLPLSCLSLKKGCPIIILRNLDPKHGLCNGTRATVMNQNLNSHVLEVQLMGGDHDGEIALIPRITLSPSIHTVDHAIHFKRRQFPIQLTFAMTINKAQGQSVKYVGIDLHTPVFSHGQLYVTFSRATSYNCIKVLLENETETCGNLTPNVVYNEVLLD